MTTVADVRPAAVERPARPVRTIIVVVLGLATVAVLCGWAIYLDLHDLIGRTALVYALLFAFVPVVPLAAAFLWLDRVRPEPPWLLVATLAWGALGATAIALQVNSWLAGEVGDRYGATARSAVFIAPWVEETCKAAVIFVIAWSRGHRLGGPLAGAVYGGLVGIGFAFTENIVYYGQLFQRVNDYQGGQHVALQAVEHLFLWRGVAAPFVHPMFTMVTGLGIGFAAQARDRAARVVAPVAGFCVAVLLHMGYNAAASFSPGSALTAVYVGVLLPVVTALGLGLLALRRRELRVIGARLQDYAAFGWASPAHVSMLADARTRRIARRDARRAGDRRLADVRAMQRAGTDLGAFRDRAVRGVTAPAESAAEREQVRVFRAACQRVPLPADAIPEPAPLTREGSSW